MSGFSRGGFPASSRSRSRRRVILQTQRTLEPEAENPASHRNGDSTVCAFRIETETTVAASPNGLPKDGIALAAVLSLFPQLGRDAFDSNGAPGLNMSLPRFKRLAAQMPKIAKIVNQFQSPEIQREVLQALVRAFEAELTAEDAHEARNGAVNGSLPISADTAPAFFDDSTAAAMHDEAALLGEEGSSIHL